MWTRRSQLAIIYIRVGKIRIPIVLPMGYFSMIVDEVQDIMIFFKWINDKVFNILEIVEVVISLLRDCKNEDILDIDVKGKDERVKIKWMMR